MDIWVAVNRPNAQKIVAVLTQFGFFSPELNEELFLQEHQVARMGIAPFRLEITTSIDGVKFAECFAARETVIIEGVAVNLISLQHLRINKKASGRLKDLHDLENLP